MYMDEIDKSIRYLSPLCSQATTGITSSITISNGNKCSWHAHNPTSFNRYLVSFLQTFGFSERANSTQNRQDTTHSCNLLVIIFLLHFGCGFLNGNGIKWYWNHGCLRVTNGTIGHSWTPCVFLVADPWRLTYKFADWF